MLLAFPGCFLWEDGVVLKRTEAVALLCPGACHHLLLGIPGQGSDLVGHGMGWLGQYFSHQVWSSPVVVSSGSAHIFC